MQMYDCTIDSVDQLEHLLDAQDGLVTTLANASAFLNEFLPDINWVGFYLLQDGALRLGPFQGKPACTRISVGIEHSLLRTFTRFPGILPATERATASWSSCCTMRREHRREYWISTVRCIRVLPRKTQRIWSVRPRSSPAKSVNRFDEKDDKKENI